MQTQTGALTSKIARVAAETKAALTGETGIFKRLIAEHAEVRSLMQAAQSTSDAEERTQLMDTIRTKLTLHTEAEEKEFYSLLEGREETAETIQIHVDEHRIMAALLATLQNLHPISSEWDELVGKLFILFNSHVEREEKKLFIASKPAIDASLAADIESRFVDRKVEEAGHLDEPENQHKYDMPLP